MLSFLLYDILLSSAELIIGVTCRKPAISAPHGLPSFRCPPILARYCHFCVSFCPGGPSDYLDLAMLDAFYAKGLLYSLDTFYTSFLITTKPTHSRALNIRHAFRPLAHGYRCSCLSKGRPGETGVQGVGRTQTSMTGPRRGVGTMKTGLRTERAGGRRIRTAAGGMGVSAESAKGRLWGIG